MNEVWNVIPNKIMLSNLHTRCLTLWSPSGAAPSRSTWATPSPTSSIATPSHRTRPRPQGAEPVGEPSCQSRTTGRPTTPRWAFSEIRQVLLADVHNIFKFPIYLTYKSCFKVTTKSFPRSKLVIACNEANVKKSTWPEEVNGIPYYKALTCIENHHKLKPHRRDVRLRPYVAD